MHRAAGDRDLRERTKQFALGIIRLYGAMPGGTEAQVIGRQMLRSGTSVGAQYREACRARSVAELISKIESGLQELDETDYWMELAMDARILPPAHIEALRTEAQELMAIFVASVRTAKNNRLA